MFQTLKRKHPRQSSVQFKSIVVVFLASGIGLLLYVVQGLASSITSKQDRAHSRHFSQQPHHANVEQVAPKCSRGAPADLIRTLCCNSSFQCGRVDGHLPRTIPCTRFEPPHNFCFDFSFTSMCRINDDFCDCEDGSDEPGTSACSGSIKGLSFTCADGAEVPIELVEDGVCDCCDASDETLACTKSNSMHC